MPKKARKPATALHARERARLVADDRSFDVQLVRSALTFFNRWAAIPSGSEIPLREIVEGSYAWLPDVLAARAEVAGVDAANVKWRGDTPEALIEAFTVAFALLCGGLDFGRNQSGSVGYGGKRLTAAQWFTRCLAPLPIYARFHFDGRTVRRAEVPCITTVQRALAYALAVLLEDRWQVRDRVKRCPYERHGMHFFLDYRTDDEGRFLPGEQMKYCSSKHSNAHRQQLWRDEHKESKR